MLGNDRSHSWSEGRPYRACWRVGWLGERADLAHQRLHQVLGRSRRADEQLPSWGSAGNFCWSARHGRIRTSLTASRSSPPTPKL